MSDDEGERTPDPTVHNEMTGVVHGPVVMAGSIDQVVFQTETPSFPLPSQLPPAPRSFANREHEVDQLDQWLGKSGAGQLFVVSGPAGVGKTTLVLHWLHRIRARFPDGQLHMDLGAFAADGPVDPTEALEWFLLALGVPEENVPSDPQRREALYRSVVADKAVVVLLDNALSAAQVRPLLPGSARSVVVVTSRWRLTGLRLDGANFLYVDPMNVADSVRLLHDLVGDDRLAEQHTEAEELARLCGGLPIALSVIGARLSARPHRSLSREVGELRREDRLAALSLRDELSVEVVFDVAYADLPADQAHYYRLCALHPGPVFGVEVAAAMAEESVDGAEDTLDALVQRNLLSEVDDRRFRYHDLLLLHARQQATRLDGEPVREGVARRMVEWYLDSAVAADLVLRPTRRRVGPRFRRPPSRSDLFRTHREALRWVERERRNIVRAVRLADQRGWDQPVWEFCEAMWGYYVLVRNHGDLQELHDRGIPAAHRCGGPLAEAQLRNQLGAVLANLRRYDEAIREIQMALRLGERGGDDFIRASALFELGVAMRGKGDLDGALRELNRAKEIREVIGTPRALALCRRRIGEVLIETGRYSEAVAELRAVADAMARVDRGQWARALTALGSAYVRWGRFAEAAEPLAEAFALATELESTHYLAGARTVLGELAESTGDLTGAREHYAEAHRVYVDSGDPRADDLAERLARVTER